MGRYRDERQGEQGAEGPSKRAAYEQDPSFRWLLDSSGRGSKSGTGTSEVKPSLLGTALARELFLQFERGSEEFRADLRNSGIEQCLGGNKPRVATRPRALSAPEMLESSGSPGCTQMSKES